MNTSGTKLVLVLVGGALVLGGVSWWYRFEAAHRASQFWGPVESRLIAESEGFDAILFEPCTEAGLADLGNGAFGRKISLHDARGQAHLRHAIMSDRNYRWRQPHDPETTMWRLCLLFHDKDQENDDQEDYEQEVYVLLSEGFDTIGKYDPATHTVVGFSCEPMAKSMQQYFGPLEAQPADASTFAE